MIGLSQLIPFWILDFGATLILGSPQVEEVA